MANSLTSDPGSSGEILRRVVVEDPSYLTEVFALHREKPRRTVRLDRRLPGTHRFEND
jgi:hypothetical protein